MKSLVSLALILFCPLSFTTVSNAQTHPDKNQLRPYEDTDGYQVLSTIIDARTIKMKSESVSISHQTVSGEAVRGVRFQCAGSIPAEFQGAEEDFDKKAKTQFVLRPQFSIEKKYRLVEDQSRAASPSSAFFVSAVGFDENKAHAIALVGYIVHNGGTIGGDSTFHLLRKTQLGWQEAKEIPSCGRIY